MHICSFATNTKELTFDKLSVLTYAVVKDLFFFMPLETT